jgi:integrating conjugative element protein (TIGR03759 family)
LSLAQRTVVLAAVGMTFYSPSGWSDSASRETPMTELSVSVTPTRPAAQDDGAAQSARDWGLSREEWSRYRQLMRGPLGIFSPNLDPLTALGIEARSEAERTHIAELQARMEGQRVTKLLTYQRAYDAAWQRLYPTLLPFQTGSQQNRPSTTATEKSTQRLAVFVKEDCPVCDQQVKALEGRGQPFDLYMVGTRGEDARIRAWAMRLKIDPTKVRAGIITLNHDAGRWLTLGLPGTLPAVLHSVDGRWAREP